MENIRDAAQIGGRAILPNATYFSRCCDETEIFSGTYVFRQKCVTLGRFGEPHANRLLGSGQAYSRSAPTYERTNEINDLQYMLEK